MEKQFVGLGLVAGLLGGIAAYIFARVQIEPLVSQAIAYEDGRGEAEHHLAEMTGAPMEHGHDAEVFSRTIQEGIGAGTGTVAFGLVMGAFFAVAFTLAALFVAKYRPGTDLRVVAGALAFGGFVAFFAGPFFLYPANPPSVGNPDTIADRSGTYLVAVIVSVVAVAASAALGIYLSDKVNRLVGFVSGVALYLVVMIITGSSMEHFHEVPTPLMNGDTVLYPGFPAEVLGEFRVYTVVNQIILWAVVATVFISGLGWLQRRAVTRASNQLVGAAAR